MMYCSFCPTLLTPRQFDLSSKMCVFFGQARIVTPVFHTFVMQAQEEKEERRVWIKGSQFLLLRIMLLQHMQILHVYSSNVPHSLISLSWIVLFFCLKTPLPWTLTIFCPKGPEERVAHKRGF